MNLLFGHDETVAAWVATRAKGKPFVPPYTAIGILDADGKALRGGFVFTGRTTDSIEMSGAGIATTHREAWRALLHYVFVQLGCSRLQMHTRRSNKRTKKILAPERSGFTFEGVSRRLYGREDGIRFSLVADDLPGFREKWGL